ncbi:MAG: hypothetical protein RXN90_07750, partial [Thermoproteus sp.]
SDRDMERKFSVDELRRRLEPALRPAEPPTVEEVLEQVSTRGVLRGPVDWVFPAWITYIEYATQRIAEAFQLTEEERGQLFHFRDTMKRLLLEAWRQAKEKLTTLYNAIMEGTYRVEGNRLYAPDGTWMYVREGFAPRITIHGVNASAHFPDILKLPRERLELLQLGWRASDEGNNDGRASMGTTQPWQAFAWAAARYGAFYIRIASVNLMREGASIHIQIRAKDWKQRWSKDEAISLLAVYLRHGEWAPLFTAWLGDGKAKRKRVLRGKYEVMISIKEPWRLGIRKGAYEAVVATGKEAFVKLKEAAGVYGELLDLLRAHKWIYIKLATDNDLRAAYKLKTKKRSIDVLRDAYRRNNDESPTGQFSYVEGDRPRRGDVVVAGVMMSFRLVKGRSTSLYADRYACDLRKALAIAGRLESAGLRPNITRVGTCYIVYITTADLLRLAEKDEAVRKAIALYLAEKAKNGSPKQRELAKKFLQHHPIFYSFNHLAVSLPPRYRRASADVEPKRRA